MKHYLWILKTTHGGADMDTCLEMAKGGLDGDSLPVAAWYCLPVTACYSMPVTACLPQHGTAGLSQHGTPCLSQHDTA